MIFGRMVVRGWFVESHGNHENHGDHENHKMKI